jgi:hypothetical protein
MNQTFDYDNDDDDDGELRNSQDFACASGTFIIAMI